jgi:hypothetical protein
MHYAADILTAFDQSTAVLLDPVGPPDLFVRLINDVYQFMMPGHACICCVGMSLFKVSRAWNLCVVFGVGSSVSLFPVLCCCVVGRLFYTVLFLCVDSSFCLLWERTAGCAVFLGLCALYHQESCDAMCHLVTAETH